MYTCIFMYISICPLTIIINRLIFVIFNFVIFSLIFISVIATVFFISVVTYPLNFTETVFYG